MGDAIRTVVSKYATFTGRAARPEFWWWVLFAFIVMFVARFIDQLIFGQPVVTDGFMVYSPQPLSSIVGLVLFLPYLAVAVRRLHDTGRSGWWWLINLIPLIGWLIFLYFAVQPSDEGTNEFG
jgi:uncharacterized membrane protein YhaH (DUF805 family)